MEDNALEVTLHPDGTVNIIDVYLRGVRIQRWNYPVGVFPQDRLDDYNNWYFTLDYNKFNDSLNAGLTREGITIERARELYGRTR